MSKPDLLPQRPELKIIDEFGKEKIVELNCDYAIKSSMEMGWSLRQIAKTTPMTNEEALRFSREARENFNTAIKAECHKLTYDNWKTNKKIKMPHPFFETTPSD